MEKTSDWFCGVGYSGSNCGEIRSLYGYIKNDFMGIKKHLKAIIYRYYYNPDLELRILELRKMLNNLGPLDFLFQKKDWVNFKQKCQEMERLYEEKVQLSQALSEIQVDQILSCKKMGEILVSTREVILVLQRSDYLHSLAQQRMTINAALNEIRNRCYIYVSLFLGFVSLFVSFT